MTSDNRNPSQSNENNDDLFSIFMALDKKSLDKRKDIDILYQMRQSIIDYETGQSQIEYVLIIIGDLSSKITYNDNNDPNSEYIRNQYGFIRRNQDKSINKNGIYFESLSYLANLLSDLCIYAFVNKLEMNNLGPELKCLKQKIELILSEQNSTSDNGESFDQSFIDISKLTGFAIKYHEQMFLWRICQEMTKMEDIDFRIKEDRYYFGRVYSIIGELFNEWLQNQENMEENKLIKTLKQLIKLRDGLVHHHERINSLTESDNESINKIIVELKSHLICIMEVNQSNGLVFKINLAYHSTDEFNKLLNELSALLFGKSMKAKIDTKKNEDKMSNDEKIKKTLHRCIKRAYEIIIGTSQESNIDNESINKQNKILQSINENYEKNLNNLSEEDRKNFPSTLDSGHIEEMKSLQRHLVQNKSVSSLKASDGLLDKFLKKMTVIMEEMQYIIYFLPRLWDEKEIRPTTKKSYIIEYSILVIGQLVRDIESVNICQSIYNGGDSNFNNQSNLADFTRFIPSNTIREAASRLKTLRNQGLAHNVWNLDENSFKKNLSQIGSVLIQFQNFYYFIKKDLMPENCESLYYIGCFLMESDKYAEAIYYFEKCRTRLSDYLNKTEAELLSFYRYNDLEKICQMKPILWFTLIELAKAYSEIGNSEKSKEIALYLLEQVDYDEDSDVVTDTFQIFLEHLCQIFTLLKDYLDPNLYIELLESFDERYGNVFFTFKIGEFYREQKNYEKAKEVFKYIFENCPQTNYKILSVRKCVDICLEQNRLFSTSEVDTVLDPMVAWLDANDIVLSLEILNSYFILKYSHCFRRLISIEKNICLDGINESEVRELRKLSTQLREIYVKSQNCNLASQIVIIDPFINTSWVLILVLSLDIGTCLDTSLLPNVFKGKPEMTTIQMENMTILSNIFTDLINKDRELKKRNPHPTNERNGLSMKESGDCLYLYAEWFRKIFQNNNSNISASSLSQDLFRCAIKCLNEFLKYCNGKINPTHDLITDASIKIGYCLSSLSLLSCDLPGLIFNISTLIRVLRNLYTVKYRRSLMQTIEMLENIRDETISVLNQILEAPNDDFRLNFHDEFVVRYLAEHFDIRINENDSGKSLIYEGTFDELQNKIRLHVNSNNLNVDETNETAKTRSKKSSNKNHRGILARCLHSYRNVFKCFGKSNFS